MTEQILLSPIAPLSTPDLARRERLAAPTWTWEPSGRWVRGFVGGTAVVDSRRPILVWEPGAKVPEYGFPREDVHTDLLVPGGPPRQDYYRPRLPAGRWFDLVLGDRRIPAAAWTWDLDALGGFIALSWFPGVLDRWTEEDEVVFAHPRDPRSRVDALPSSRHVVVKDNDIVLAESSSPVIVYETGLPPRHYLPREDVVWSRLVPIEEWSECPYKGYATEYWATAADPTVPVAWSYPDPLPAVRAIAGRVAFYSERVTLRAD